MNRKKVDSQRERRILTALVVSKPFLTQAAKALDLSLVESEHFKVVAGWCLDYFKEYGKAPGKHLEDLYHSWSEDNENDALVSAVKDFLESLSEEYGRGDEINVQYLLDDLSDFLAKRKIVRLREDLEYALSTGDVKTAQETVVGYKRVEIGASAGSDPMNDKEGWKRAFESVKEPLISFEGDAGKFFNRVLTTDACVGIQAGEKMGKTWWCVEFAMRALRQRQRVAVFETGDLSESQIYLRLGVRWSGRPMDEEDTKRKIEIPHSINLDEAEDAGYSIESQGVRFRRVMDRHSVERGIKRFRRACGMVPGTSYIRTSVHPSKTINVRGIESILDQWEQDHNFIPKVIIVDYADILDDEDEVRKADPRHKVNATWTALRRLSLQRHCLVIVPTQANADIYGHKGDRLQSMDNYSEDKRKYAHVTAMMGLNQTPAEKEIGGMRLNWLVVRGAPFNSARPLYVGTCFSLGRALCCAKFSSRIQEPE